MRGSRNIRGPCYFVLQREKKGPPSHTLLNSQICPLHCCCLTTFLRRLVGAALFRNAADAAALVQPPRARRSLRGVLRLPPRNGWGRRESREDEGEDDGFTADDAWIVHHTLARLVFDLPHCAKHKSLFAHHVVGIVGFLIALYKDNECGHRFVPTLWWPRSPSSH